MRILHAPVEVAGQLGFSVLGLQTTDHEVAACFEEHAFKYRYLEPDYSLGPTQQRPFPRLVRRLGVALKVWQKFDVYHFHFLSSILGAKLGYSDAWLYRLSGKKVIVEAWGSDVRLPQLTKKRNPYYAQPKYEDDRQAHKRMETWSRLTRGHIIAFDPTLHEGLKTHFSFVHQVNQRIDTTQFVPIYASSEKKVPRVVHAPSDPLVKGTQTIRRVVEQLKVKGLDFEYIELSGLPHSKVIEAVAGADLVVDQICLGMHGVFALEAMALGKPVVCYLQEDSNSPIINANPHTLEGVLEQWLQSPEERYKRGLQSRAYVEQHHDMRVVAQRLLEVYKQLPS